MKTEANKIELNIIKEFNDYVARIEDDYKQATENQSHWDKVISDCYHFLEFETVPAPVLAQVTAKLREALRERRKAKEMIEQLLYVKRRLGSTKNLKQETTEKTYGYRTDFLNDILKEIGK